MLDEAREKGKREAGNGVAKEMAMESIQTGVVCRRGVHLGNSPARSACCTGPTHHVMPHIAASHVVPVVWL